MAVYTYENITEQLGNSHKNAVVAVRIDTASTPIFNILDQKKANADGTFQLKWDDWSGRIMVGAADEDESVQLDCVFHDFVDSTLYEYADSVLDRGPVAYFKLDELSGAALDSSGNNNHGTYFGSPTRAQPSHVKTGGYSVSFDGVDDYISQPVKLGSVGSVEMWIDPVEAAGTAVSHYFSTRNDTGATNDNIFTMQNFINGSSYWGWIVGGVDRRVVTSQPFPDGPFHVVLTWDTATGITSLYWDGVLVGLTTGLTSTFTMSAAPAIGVIVFENGIPDAGSPSRYATAEIDEVAIYNTVLSPADILEHYNIGKYNKLNPEYSEAIVDDGPLLYYKLDEAAGTTAVDSSGNGNHGTFTGGVALNQPSLVEGDGGSATFDGVDDYIAGPTVVTGYPVTLEAWVTIPTAPTSNLPIITTNDVDDAYYGLAFAVNPSGTISVRAGTGGAPIVGNRTSIASSKSITFGTVNHIVAVCRSRTDVDLYINAEEDTGTVTTGTGTTVSFAAGSVSVGRDLSLDTPPGAIWFDGTLDEAVIYNYALDPASIKEHYNIGIKKLIPTAGLKAWYKFDESPYSADIIDYHGTFDGLASAGSIREIDTIHGNGIVGDGSGSISLATATDLYNLQATNEFTVAVWVNPATLADWTILDLNNRSAGSVADNNYGLLFFFNGSSIVFRVEQRITTGFGGQGQGYWGTGVSPDANEWQLVVMDRTNTEANIYIYGSYGVRSATLSFAGSNLDYWDNVADANRLTHNLILARKNGSFSTAISPAGSKMDSLLVYNRVLNTQERDALWNYGKGLNTI